MKEKKTRMRGESALPMVRLTVPVMDQSKFAEETGLRPGQIIGQAFRANLPIIKIGKFALINVARLTICDSQCLMASLISTPVMTPEEFGRHVGLDKGRIITQLELGNLPRKNVGRLLLVDVAELTRMCLQAEDE